MSFTEELARHKAQLFRLLSEILDNPKLSTKMYFKGGTCAKMLGWLDRFSVDLDFDLDESADKDIFRKEFHRIFKDLDLLVKDESREALQFFLKYDAPEGQRNTIKLEILDKVFKHNKYKSYYLSPVERTALCQTKETMFAHKLVALKDRFEKGQGIAGRDLYDIHHFFIQGFDYNHALIKERTGKNALDYLRPLQGFIQDKVTQKQIEEDLNVLLEYNKFKKIRKYLKEETLRFIKEEIEKLE